MLYHEHSNPCEFVSAKAVIRSERNLLQPVFCHVIVALNVDVRRFLILAAIEKNRYGPIQSTVGMAQGYSGIVRRAQKLTSDPRTTA